jgi:prevent-host-death family protein
MKIASVADVQSRFSEFVKASAQGPVVVTRNGKPVAALLSIEDEEELERLILAYSPRLRSILEAAEQRVRQGKGIQHDEFWRRVQSPEASSSPRRSRKRKAG